MQNKTDVLKKEINLISSTEIKEITISLIGKLPDYFFEVPASSTGKYHPKYALGNGGLIRHTKAATRIANELFALEMFKGLLKEKDYILAALILHDGLKHGQTLSKFTVSDHPVQAANFIRNAEIKNNSKCLFPKIKQWYIRKKISELVISHMGQWNKDYKTQQELMPKPKTRAQRFVHLCDYLASRKCLEFNFEVFDADF